VRPGAIFTGCLTTVCFTTVCFDWDGTLCDSGAAGMRAFQKSLAEFGIAFTEPEYWAIYTPHWHRMYEVLGLPADEWHRADKRWLHHYQEEQPPLLPGAAELLAALQRRAIRMGLVSSGTRSRVVLELDRLGLSSVFRALVCNEDVAHKKPHPEGLERAMALMGMGRDACCFVGDTAEDVQMGKSAGVFTIGVRTGDVDCARLEACGPDVMIDSIGELAAVLGI
jgi:HAD superfamily hydrolase (TIGR01509 family)